MKKLTSIRIAAGLLAAAAMALGQSPGAPTSAPLSFEVASIRPSGPFDPAAIMSGKAHVGMSVDLARVDIGNASVMGLICQAYKVRPYQVAGGPDWLRAGMSADRFDILAKMPAGATKEQVPEMLQALLAERFKLTLHREKRDTPVYAMSVGKGGPKLKEAPPEPAPTETQAAPSNGSSPSESQSAKPATAKGEFAFGSGDNRVTMKQSGTGMSINSKETGPMRISRGDKGELRMEADRMSMEMLAGMLSQYLDRPVVDQTELKGRYQVSLELSMDTIMAMARKAGMNMPMGPAAGASAGGPADAASDPSAGSLFSSVRQLGLKLEPRRLPYELLVIDRVEKTPTEN